MPTFEVSKSRVIAKLGKRITEELLADRIAMMGAVVERVDGDTMAIEAFPNRPDLLSEEGLVRALRGFMGIETGLPKYTVNKSDYRATVDPKVKGVREHVVAAVVKGLSIDEDHLVSLMQIQEKLHMTHSRKRKLAAIGVHDLREVNFPVRYTAVRGDFKFVPLGYAREMSIAEILREHPKGKEYAHLLPGNSYPIWLDSKDEVLALPPVINAAKTSVTPETRDVFIDVTGLNRRVVEQALNIVVSQLIDMGGEAYLVHFGDHATPNLEPRRVALDTGYVNRLLGLEMGQKEIGSLLEKMRYGVEKGGVLVPPYRTDVLHPIDLVEDVAIAYGYENFEPEIPQVATIGEESDGAIFRRKLAELVVGFGFLECNTYHLSSKETLLKKMRRPDTKLVQTKSAVNIHYDTFRDSLLPGLMQILSENRHYEYPQKIFDMGAVVGRGIEEEQMLGLASCHSKADFTEMKSLVEAIARAVGKKAGFKAVDHPPFIPGRAAAILVNKKEIGIVGEVHPEVLNSFELDLPVSAIELKAGGLTSS